LTELQNLVELKFEPHDFKEILERFLASDEQILLSYKNGSDH
jgi:hypothetical protein